jgi:hypothetical protein
MSDGQDALAALLHGSARTWRLSDGRGALSRGTASGAATRRGHALLAAPLVGPRAELPAVSLLRFDDRVTPDEGPAFELTPAFVLAGRGDATPQLAVRAGLPPTLESFREQPWPRWRFRGDGWLIEREYRLIEGHAALLASWRLLAGGPVRLHVAPLLVARSLAGLQSETPEFRGAVTGIPGRVRCVTVEGYAPVTLWHGGAFMPARAWQRGLAYPYDGAETADAAEDPEAGAATPSEDAFLPGWIQSALTAPGAALHVVASPEEHLFRALATESRLGVPPARTLADCLAVLDLAEGERRDAWYTSALEGAACTARLAAVAHAGRSATDEPTASGRPGGATAAGAASSESAAGPAGAARAAGVPERAHDVSRPEFVASLAARLHDALHERADRTAVLTDAALAEERGPEALRVAAGLVTLRAFASVRDIARGYLAYLDEGLAPERFDAEGLPHYGTPEASLWLVHVLDLLARRDAESEETRTFLADGAYRSLEGVLQHLRAGSRHGVRCDRDGFLWAGEGDAACSRADLNALWYHALVAMSQLAKRAKRRENAAFYMAWARELQRAYVDRFWDDAGSCLFSETSEGGMLRGATPSQLYALSLPPMLLPPELGVRLVDTLTRELFTPRGLRPRPGDGTPEPAWLGPWASAMLRAHARDPHSAARVHAALAGYADLGEADAAELTPRGAADLLRAWIEEVDHTLAPADSIQQA